MGYRLTQFCCNGHDTITYGRQKSGQCRKCNRVSLKNSILRMKELIWSIKMSNVCCDCGEFYHPCQMQFDHLMNKVFEIDYSEIHSWNALITEIAKCQLVCSNCHDMRTYLRQSKFNIY